MPFNTLMLELSSVVFRTNNPKIEIHLFILYNIRLEIINFLYKNLRSAERRAKYYLTLY